MKGNFLSRTRYVIPLFIAILLLIYFRAVLADSREKFEDRLITEEIERIKYMTDAFEKEELEYSGDDTLIHSVAIDYIVSAVEEMDRQYGVFACVFDSEFNLVTERFAADSEVVMCADFSEMERAYMAQTGSGYLLMGIGDLRMKVFFASYPRDEVEYYIAIGVSPYAFDEIFNVNRIALILFIIIAAMIAGLYWIIIHINKTYPV